MNRKAAFEKLGFQFEAEKDVEIVGNFISFDADEGTLHGIGGTPAVVLVVAG